MDSPQQLYLQANDDKLSGCISNPIPLKEDVTQSDAGVKTDPNGPTQAQYSIRIQKLGVTLLESIM